jgi:hypothetical protein
VRTDSESYLISVYRCPTRLPKREGTQEEQEQEEGEGEQEEGDGEEGEGEEQEQFDSFYQSEGYGGMFPGGPGLRRKKLSLNPNEKRKKWKIRAADFLRILLPS